MYLSRIRIENFRNFKLLDVELSGDVVFVGENRVGKSNLIYALRIIFDPSLPDSARQLGLTDFWDGIEEPTTNDKIVISVEIKDFDSDPDILASLTDFRLNDDPDTVRLSYELRPQADLEGAPSSSEDYEFICYGGENEAKRFNHNLRRRITMDVLPALRDAEGDLANWGRSPLRPLIENAFKDIGVSDLKEISEAIEDATSQIVEFEEVKKLEGSISSLFSDMSGPKQDINPRLGFNPTDPKRLYRSLRLLIDEGKRGVNDASLGSANLIFLSLKILEIKNLITENSRDHTFLSIEEPEAHLHPHLQRSVYRQIFDTNAEEDDTKPLSVLLTTHSPHIASVAPLRSIVLLKDEGGEGTCGYSAKSIKLTKSEVDDIARYIDVTRAEILFARGVILVEGDAERFLVPAFADTVGKSLDDLGITICSVSGTNFIPYIKLLVGLGIPFSVITDWDPKDNKIPLGLNRSLKIIRYIEEKRTGKKADKLINELKAIKDYNEFGTRCEEFGVFTNITTLEVDLFKDGFGNAMIATLRECNLGVKSNAIINNWESDIKDLDSKKLLSLVESIGKGRFAQRLLSHISDIKPPAYISDAIKFVADRV